MFNKIETILESVKSIKNKSVGWEQLQLTLLEMTKDMNESKQKTILGPKIFDLLNQINRE